MHEICLAIYERFGQDAVLGFCDLVDWQEWLVCDGCEIESPVDDGSCLVCGLEAV